MPDTDRGRFRIVLIEDSPLLCAMLREMLDELEGVELLPMPPTSKARSVSSSSIRPISPSWTLSVQAVAWCAEPGQGRARALWPPRAVVFSNHGHSTVRARCTALGAEHFFDKSFQLDDLLDFIQAAVARH